MAEKIWQYKNSLRKPGEDRAMAAELKIPEMIASVLLNRGITQDEVIPFLKNSMRDIINPMLLNDMDKAVERIGRAVKDGEQITVYGDYDVDGITSTALLYDFLQFLGAHVSYYIPDRRDEGYGINIMAVNKLQKAGTRLLITVDCGITAVGEVEFAKLRGMDVIITDHHTCKERMPGAAAAIINPKRHDSEYPFDALAGVGVAFKLVLALAMNFKLNTNECFRKYADLAAIGTVADVVSLTGENRIIVDKGLAVLKNPQRPGLRALKRIAGISDKPVTAANVAFAIAPRLNAAGRLGTATTAVELLLTADEKRAEEIAGELDRENRERQATELEIFREALEMIDSDPDFEKKKVIVLAHEDWHHGVIGIVASRICERYYRPCILISYSNGIGKGSGRSIKGFNLFDALTACEDCLSEFGGHAVAAGLNINVSDINRFSEKINKYAEERLRGDLLLPQISIDCEITPADISMGNAKMLERLEPYGMGNEKPVFSMSNMSIADIQAVGNEGKHLRIKFLVDGVYINGIGFSLGRLSETFHRGDKVRTAFGLDINEFQGRQSVQLTVKDLKKSER